jgi:heme/copper-type cytochrome/quinol oxidase subunit 4
VQEIDKLRRNLIIGGFTLALVLSIIFTAILVTFTTTNFFSAEGWSAVAAFLSVVVALIALYALIYQTKIADRGARLSVMPHCLLIPVIPNFSGKLVCLQLQNNGSGPAIISEWKFVVDGHRISDTNVDGMNAVLKRYGLQWLVEGSVLPPKSSVAATTTIDLFHIPYGQEYNTVSCEGNPMPAHQAFSKLLRHVQVNLTYTSVYEDDPQNVSSK